MQCLFSSFGQGGDVRLRAEACSEAAIQNVPLTPAETAQTGLRSGYCS